MWVSVGSDPLNMTGLAALSTSGAMAWVWVEDCGPI